MSAQLTQDELLLKLTSKAKAFASKFDGIEYEEFLSEAWLAFNEAKQKGASDALALTKAEYACVDAQERWIGHEKNQVVEDNFDFMGLKLHWKCNKVKRTRLPRKIKKLLNQLTDDEKRVLYMTYMWNRQANEIAEDMNLKTQRVFNIKHTAISKLKRWTSPPKEKVRRKPFKTFPRVKDAQGNVYEIDTTLKQFCEKHNLDAKLMSLMLNGKNAKSHRGWTVDN